MLKGFSAHFRSTIVWWYAIVFWVVVGADPYNLIAYFVRSPDIFIQTCRDRRPRLSEKNNE